MARSAAAFAAFVMMLSGCLATDGGADSDSAADPTPSGPNAPPSAERGQTKSEYETGQEVWFDDYSAGTKWSAGSDATGMTRSKAWLNVTSFRCVALEPDLVECRIDVFGTAWGRNDHLEVRMAGAGQMQEQRSAFDCVAPAGTDCLRTLSFSATKRHDLTNRSGRFEADMNTRIEGLVLGQPASFSQSSRQLHIDYTLAPPGKQGSPWVPPPPVPPWG